MQPAQPFARRCFSVWKCNPASAPSWVTGRRTLSYLSPLYTAADTNHAMFGGLSIFASTE